MIDVNELQMIIMVLIMIALLGLLSKALALGELVVFGVAMTLEHAGRLR